ncbi:sensor histidine kinase [Lysobacter humi (ex Lee et al. 2017)]
MPPVLRTLLQPLNLAGMLTWLAVALSLGAERGDLVPTWAALAGFLLLFLAHSFIGEQASRRSAAIIALQAACALAVVALAPRGGTAPVLLVVLVAQAAHWLSPRATLLLGLVLDVALWGLLQHAGHPAPFIVTVVYAGFQAFAALTAHYAQTAMRSRDALARVNADLLATRALLADSARDAERLRVARELHDVAGHKLTALMLNLRVLQGDPALAGRHEIDVARRMAQELLGDLRDVVHALRDTRGLDLATALRALAAPMPRPALRLDIAHDVRVDDPAVAEAILRLVQEALTNAARHAGADAVQVRLHRAAGALHVHVEDDGRLRGPVREGSGLAGMRERVAALGGRLAWSRTAAGGMAIDAELPA